LEESKIGVDNVVEGDDGCRPRVIEMLQCLASGLIGYNAVVNRLSAAVNAAAESAAEQTDTHDAEQQPEHEADEQNVQDRRNRLE